MPSKAVFASQQDFSRSESIRHSGFVAQEVEKAAKEAGYDFNGIIVPENDRQTYSLSYAQFVVPLVKAVQEQQIIIENLKKQVEQSEIKAVVGKQQQQIKELSEKNKQADETNEQLRQQLQSVMATIDMLNKKVELLAMRSNNTNMVAQTDKK